MNHDDLDMWQRTLTDDPTLVPGMEAGAYVGGAMGCPDEQALDRYIESILTGRGAFFWLSPGERAAVAASAVRGYVNHQDGAVPSVLVWHRLIGSTCVQVVRV